MLVLLSQVLRTYYVAQARQSNSDCSFFFSYATSMTFVCPSVTLVYCDHVVQQKVEIGNDRIGRRLGNVQAEFAIRITVSCDPEFYTEEDE